MQTQTEQLADRIVDRVMRCLRRRGIIGGLAFAAYQTEGNSTHAALLAAVLEELRRETPENGAGES